MEEFTIYKLTNDNLPAHVVALSLSNRRSAEPTVQRRELTLTGFKTLLGFDRLSMTARGGQILNSQLSILNYRNGGFTISASKNLSRTLIKIFVPTVAYDVCT